MTARPELADELRRRLGGLGYGGDYNPEQWPEEVWAEDMALMKAAGVNLATVGVFSWAIVEPQPDTFDFSLFDKVMDLLAAHGIVADLATMTASPPPWMTTHFPQALPQRKDGTQLWHGSRRHYCPSSPDYRERIAILVETLAARYADHPALGMWHVDNEYTGAVPECYCDASAEHFRRWLADRYGDIDGLNNAWSTNFWSQRYASFAEVLPPRTTPGAVNPTSVLDFQRFSSDAYLECYLLQVDILRRHTPDVPITTNLLPLPRAMDLFAWAGHWDVTSIDAYPDPLDAGSYHDAGFTFDLARSLRRGQPWVLMEQASGAVNWRRRCAPKAAGTMRRQSLQAVAHGADAVLFFQWRQSRGGAEKFHSAMLPHTGPQSRTHQEIRALGTELAGSVDIAGTTVVVDAAVAMDWHNWWAVELSGHPSDDVDYRKLMRSWHAVAMDTQMTCDIVHPASELSPYPLVLVPNLYLLESDTARNLAEYVRAGGTVVLGYFSGIVDSCERLHPGGYGTPLSELLGVRVDEFWPLPEDARVGVRLGDRTWSASHWTEEITPTTAEVVATYEGTELHGRAAVTRNAYGRGTAWYIGAQLDADLLRLLIERARDAAGIVPAVPGLPAGVQAVRRRSEQVEFLFLLNHTEDEHVIELPTGSVSLAARDVVVRRQFFTAPAMPSTK